VLEDSNRDARLALIHTPEQPAVLSKEVLNVQFKNNPSKYIPPELIDHIEQSIIGTIHQIDE
jgi:hypothetical protein